VEASSDLPKLGVSNPLRQDTVIRKEYVCQISAIRHIELRALVGGYLEHIHVDEGQAVSAGQAMFEIMPRLYQARFDKAQAEAKFAEVQFENTQRLAHTKVVASSELALARAKLDKAKAALALNQVYLDLTHVKAPFDGMMGKFYVRPGSLVEKGQLLTTLSDNSQVWVYFNVPEAEYLSYRRRGLQDNRMHVHLKLADNTIYEQLGELTAIEADFNNHTGTIAFRATFANPDGLLRHGETGQILVDETIKDALIVPQSTVMEVLDKRFVLVVDSEGKVSTREVKIGAQLPDLFVISEGLSETDRILLEGQRKVIDGDIIHPEFESPDRVITGLKVYAE
jgi:membrane fusion protein (multidrug efflux system)